jgi:Fur family ferric uptake transcriptional regulator
MNTVPNQRNTKQRQIILEELRTLKSHPTAAELYQIVRKRLPKISLGTVYRNLELLVDSGTIRKLHAGGKEARFDSETRQHHHIYCVKCGRMDDLPNAPGNQSCESRVELNGWQIKEYRVAFLGVCPDCRSQQATAENQLAREFTVIRY